MRIPVNFLLMEINNLKNILDVLVIGEIDFSSTRAFMHKFENLTIASGEIS
jgi:anti-anti-sigma regulatory factor